MTRPELARDEAAAPIAEPDPARDPVGTVRVHPDDDPAARGARRYIRTAVVVGVRRRIDDAIPWMLLTGWGMLHAPDTYVDDWPVQTLLELGAVFGHATTAGGAR